MNFRIKEKLKLREKAYYNDVTVLRDRATKTINIKGAL